MNFTDRLKMLRNNAGYSIGEVAEKLGIKERRYYSYETGERRADSNILIAIALLYNVSTDYLLDVNAKKDRPSIDDLSAINEKLKLMSDDSLIQLERFVDYLLWEEEH